MEIPISRKTKKTVRLFDRENFKTSGLFLKPNQAIIIGYARGASAARWS